ncbi:hypothetical protein LWP59_14455 [Amycolatopsis acidiphila]|uniref:Uncharacterized protein n=1 Tax=Amycolatopsis acidiphila TaxID=715473 RepID=A0A558AKH2_9PSEU|nr:hypothetical protein [Amycolatopsis acidiphila]TVT24768.1 hypothetical protein FNH06_05155 [Amycolatopsis acidiphila]UIJ62737.1 hypothetical protein LWP59_14455 [Amycolatopsis acidiphila]GHG63887.1 hypothetical protein GCM10017788_20150 [Amycolatopsis acidiphila]
MRVLDPEQADRALAELGEESDRMAEALVAMDGHPGQRLLGGADLTGVTARRWAEASAAMSVLWEQFARHRELVDRAREVRARRARPGPAELTELTSLLTGAVVELNAERLPIERRSLTGPAVVTETVTLTELVSMMKRSYSTVTEVLAAAEKAWHATVEQLDPLDTQVRTAQALAGSLRVEEPRLSELAGELAALRRTALADPLAAGVHPPGRLAAEVADLRAGLDELVAARDGFDDRQYELEAVVDRVAGVEAEVRSVHATVLEKIAAPGLEPPGNRAPPLRARLTELADLWRAKRWRALSAALAELDRDARAALADARAQLGFATGLLDRRLELRGRLDAYRAKARRLGHVEDLELAGLHARAYELLYTIPCDLPAATIAVGRYQRALREHGKERR